MSKPKPNREIDEFVEVTWSGKKLLLKRSSLDEWYHGKSYEDRVQYMEDHPFMEQPVKIHHFDAIPDDTPPDLTDYAVVHWSGNKVIMLPKAKLDEWYNSSYEQHVDYVKKHPEWVMDDDEEK